MKINQGRDTLKGTRINQHKYIILSNRNRGNEARIQIK